MSPELEQAIKERIGLGHSKEQIASELQSAGYDEQTIEAIYQSVSSEVSVSDDVEATLPAGLDLLRQAWAFLLSRPALILLVAGPAVLVNVFAVLLEIGSIPFVGLFFVLMPILMIVQVLIQLTVARVALLAAQGENLSVTDSLKWSVRNIWSWLWVVILTFFIVFGGTLLLIVPGLIISVYVAFSIYAFMDEGKTGMAALQRSRELIYGNFWNVVSRFAVYVLVMLGVFILGTILVTAVFGVSEADYTNLTALAAMSFFDSVVTAVMTVMGVFFAASLYVALKQQVTRTIAPSAAYVGLGWFGFAVVALMASLTFMFGAATVSSLDVDQTFETLTPEEQASFDAFMEENEGAFDSFN